jgi:hypothetical protein
MGKRQDGRIEPGQKLSGAISARAWNRAQDAADVVLGDRLGFAAGPGAAFPGALIVPCQVTTTIEGVAPGYVVKLNQAGAKVIPSQSHSESEVDTRCARVFSLTGNVVVPVTMDNYEDAKTGLGVIMYGAQMPRPGQPRIVSVCIAGMCVARVRPRFVISVNGLVGPYQFMSAPVKRTNADTDQILTGAGEASSCGTHRIVQYLGSAGEALEFAVVLM